MKTFFFDFLNDSYKIPAAIRNTPNFVIEKFEMSHGCLIFLLFLHRKIISAPEETHFTVRHFKMVRISRSILITRRQVFKSDL